MDKHDYYAFAAAMCRRATELSGRKNQDYADPDADPDDPFAVWANFTACERLGICTTEQGILVRMLDKIVRISKLVGGRNPAVADESIADTLDDLHNYTVLLAGFLSAVKEHGRPAASGPKE